MLGHGGSSAGSYLVDPYLPHPLALCCNYPVSKCPSASIVATSTLRVKVMQLACRDTNDHFNLPDGFLWVCTGQHTYFITPQIRDTLLVTGILS